MPWDKQVEYWLQVRGFTTVTHTACHSGPLISPTPLPSVFHHPHHRPRQDPSHPKGGQWIDASVAKVIETNQQGRLVTLKWEEESGRIIKRNVQNKVRSGVRIYDTLCFGGGGAA